MSEEKIETVQMTEAERVASHKKHVICSIICGVMSFIIVVAVVWICCAMGLNRGDDNHSALGVHILEYFHRFYN